MPYFVFKVQPFTAPEKLAEFTAFAEASSHAKSLRAAQAGADQARMTVNGGQAEIEFDCAHARLGEIRFTSNTAFTASGSHTQMSGVQPPPGAAPSS